MGASPRPSALPCRRCGRGARLTPAELPGGDDGRDLYGLPPGDFTAVRNALAKRLRAEGRKAEAALVAKLRRPPATAWALNKVAREQPGVIDAVLDAGTGLRAATDDALGGHASGLRTAQAWERRAVDAATSAAVGHLAHAGQGAGDGVKQRMAATLRAAMVDSTVAAALRNGILDDDREAPGLGLDAFSPAAAGSATRRRSGATRRPGRAAAKAGAGDVEAGNEDVATAPEGDPDPSRTGAHPSTGRAEPVREAERAESRAVQLTADADEAERSAATASDAAASARAKSEEAAGQAAVLQGIANEATSLATAARAAAEEAALAAAHARRRRPE